MQTERKWLLWIAGAAGGAVAMGVMFLLSIQTRFPLEYIPFATSIVLVTGSPEAAPARPRALVGGHVLSAIVGEIALMLGGPQPWVAAVAVGVAILVMLATDSFHPPAGINPLIIVTHSMPWSFVAAAGALMLLAYTWAWTNGVRRVRWPQRWW